MKPASEWINAVGEAVANAMFIGATPPGAEVEALIKRIQDDARVFELDAEVRWILGRPCFAVANIADILRTNGATIARKAEDEQAVALHWMLSLYFQYGANWRAEGDNQLHGRTPPANPKPETRNP